MKKTKKAKLHRHIFILNKLNHALLNIKIENKFKNKVFDIEILSEN